MVCVFKKVSYYLDITVKILTGLQLSLLRLFSFLYTGVTSADFKMHGKHFNFIKWFIELISNGVRKFLVSNFD